MRVRALWALFGLLACVEGSIAAPPRAAATGREDIVWKPLPGPGKKFALEGGGYFTYEFSEKPKIGMVIVKVQVFDKAKAQVAPFAVTGRSDMPSMAGAHDSGDVEFKLNRRNDYLLPVNVVMPGEWEVKLTFQKDGKPFLHAFLRLHV